MTVAGLGLGSHIAVVIVTYNSASVIRDAVYSVRGHLPDAELIVVDNGSSDSTIERVVSVAPDSRIIVGHGNVGFGRGCMLGARATERATVLFLNPDAAIQSVDQAGIAMIDDRQSRWGALACQVLDDGEQTSLLRPIWPWPLEILWANYLWFVKPRSLRDVKPRLFARRWYASGAAMLVRRDALMEVGGFNAGIFLYYEDVNLSARLLRAGWHIADFDGLSVSHAGQASSPRALDRELTWATLGLLEHIADDASASAATIAARLMLGSLTAVRQLASAVGRLPGPLGSSSRRKAREAFAVREQLIRAATTGTPSDETYHRAVCALRVAAKKGR